VVSLARTPAGVPAQQDEIRARIKEAASLVGKRATAEALKILEPLASDPGVASDPALLGEVQYHTANAQFILNEYPKAIELFERARASSQKAGDKTAEGRAFFREAQAHKNIGQYEIGLEEARRAVSLYEAVSNRAMTASSWTVVGGLQDLMGRFRDALESYETASRLFEGTNAPAANSLLNETAITYKNLGNYDQALVFYTRALEAHVKTGDRYSQGVTLLNIGNLHSILGQDDRALECFERALAISRDLNERRGQSIVLGNIASVLADRGEFDRATDYTVQQLKLARDLGSKNEQGLALKSLGDLDALRGDLESAARRYEEALVIQREIGARPREGSSLLALADLRLKQQLPAEAAELANRAMAIARDTASPDLEWRAAHTAGRAARDQGRIAEAVQSLRASAGIINDLRANVTSDTGKIGFLDRRQEVFQDLATVLVSAKRPEEALEAAEAGRARAFADLLAQRHVEGKPAERQPLTAVRTALNNLRTADRVATTRTGPGPSDAVREGALDKSLAGLREASRELSSLLTAESPTRLEIAEIARRMQATLVEYLVTEHSLLIWVVTPAGDIRATSVDAGRLRLEKLVEEFRKVTATAQDLTSPPPRRYLTLSRDLDALLIAPIAGWLPASPEALVVLMPHGPLPVLPFAVLRDSRGRTLVSRHTLASAPAISVYRYTGAKQQASSASPSALVVADPLSPKDAGMPALAGARAEGGMVAKRLGPDVELLSGKAASEAAVKRAAPGRRLLHFATHGVIAADRPLASSLLLTAGDGEDGYLRVDEVFGLALAADLVVLSGCSTGLGRPSGDGIIGLSRAFLYAGTPTVVVSQWDVSDRTTAFLMDRFYAGLRAGQGPAAALRAAQLATRARYPHPALWGAFVLVGEPG
jgi:CHAT domain-containing protein/Tfp pilus assembly protein PilF